MSAPETWRCPSCDRTTDEPAWLGIANPNSPALCPYCDENVELDVNEEWDRYVDAAPGGAA